MRKLVPEHIEKLVPYKPGKPVKELERELGITGSIKLASNENPLGPSPRALKAIENELAGLNRYPDGSAYELHAKLAAFVGAKAEEIFVGAGSNEILDLLFRAFLCAGEEAIIGNPSFVYYSIGLQAANARYREVPLDEGLYWSVDALLAAVNPSTKMIVVANPNNPTGTAMDSESMKRLLVETPEDVIVVLDEAYAEYADPARWGNGLAMRSLRKHVVILRTFSKAYGLAGLRVGYAVAPEQYVNYLNRIRLPFNTSSVAQAAAIAALEDSQHLSNAVALNRSERDRVTVALQSAGVEVVPSEANFVLIKSPVAALELFGALLERCVIVRPVPRPLDSYLRVTIGSPEENDRFVQTLQACTSSAL